MGEPGTSVYYYFSENFENSEEFEQKRRKIAKQVQNSRLRQNRGLPKKGNAKAMPMCYPCPRGLAIPLYNSDKEKIKFTSQWSYLLWRLWL